MSDRAPRIAPRPSPLQLVREVERGELRLITEAACKHQGEIIVNKFIRDLSDIETAYGKCCDCKNWVIRTIWFARGPECYETNLMSPREIDALIGPRMVLTDDDEERQKDWLHDFNLSNGQ